MFDDAADIARVRVEEKITQEDVLNFWGYFSIESCLSLCIHAHNTKIRRPFSTTPEMID